MAGTTDLPIEDEVAEGGPTSQSASAVEGLRAGERVLTLLATPLNFLAIRALADGPLRLAQLRRATGLPAQTTLRGHLTSLVELGVVAKRPTAEMPYSVEIELAEMGHEMLGLVACLEEWLSQMPDGPVPLESSAARGIVKALIEGWGSGMLRSLACQPMSLTELDRQIAGVSYPALERRLASMRMAGLVEARKGNGTGRPYVVTDWARRSVVPLALAIRCEQSHLRTAAAPVTQFDLEAVFMLATPLVRLAGGGDGSCQLEVDADPAKARERCGVRITVERGRVVAWAPELLSRSETSLTGSIAMWFEAISDGAADPLRVAGAQQLARGLVAGLHSALIG